MSENTTYDLSVVQAVDMEKMASLADRILAESQGTDVADCLAKAFAGISGFSRGAAEVIDTDELLQGSARESK